jgi:phospholipid/cholesterol/gamma-HCH transport system substrate-binding protein
MSRELKVGAFVLVSVLIFLGTFLYVANIQVRGVRIRYKTYFKYTAGVDPGSPVRFGGMKAGAITSIRPWREDPTKIEVLLDVKEGVPVNADSAAMLTSLSPLGDKYLEITTGTSKARRLPPGATIPSSEPVSLDDLAKQVSVIIPTVQSTLQDVQKDIDQLTGDAGVVLADAGVVLANVQSMTGPQNQRNIAFLLANARQLLDKESPRIDSVLQNLERASLQASNALNEVHTAARTANDTFANANRTIDDIRDPVKKGLEDLQSTMSDARRLIADLNTVVSADNRHNIDDTLENFRAASENLRELTASVKQRPWSLIRGKPSPDRAVPVVAARP